MKRLPMTLVLYILIPAAANLPAQGQSANQGKVTQSEQTAAGEKMTPIPPLIRQTKPNIYLPDCTRPKDHDQADLCQQMEMAKAADYAAKVAYRQYVVSIWALAGLALTVLLTFLAARAARDAAAAAQASAVTADNTLKTMQHTAKTQLRAYLQVTDTNVSEFVVGKIPKFSISIVNTGQTPAKSVRVMTSVFNTTAGTNHKVKFSAVVDWSVATIGAGKDTYQSTPCAYFTAAHHAAAIGKTTTFGVATRIRYVDVFGRRHWLTFMAMLDPSFLKGGSAPLLLTKRHNMSS